MTRIKLTVVSTLTATMILGSAVVFAAAPADEAGTGGTVAEQSSTQTELIAPSRRGGGGSGKALKK